MVCFNKRKIALGRFVILGCPKVLVVAAKILLGLLEAVGKNKNPGALLLVKNYWYMLDWYTRTMYGTTNFGTRITLRHILSRTKKRCNFLGKCVADFVSLK